MSQCVTVSLNRGRTARVLEHGELRLLWEGQAQPARRPGHRGVEVGGSGQADRGSNFPAVSGAGVVFKQKCDGTGHMAQKQLPGCSAEGGLKGTG